MPNPSPARMYIAYRTTGRDRASGRQRFDSPRLAESRSPRRGQSLVRRATAERLGDLHPDRGGFRSRVMQSTSREAYCYSSRRHRGLGETHWIRFPHILAARPIHHTPAGIDWNPPSRIPSGLRRGTACHGDSAPWTTRHAGLELGGVSFRKRAPLPVYHSGMSRPV